MTTVIESQRYDIENQPCFLQSNFCKIFTKTILFLISAAIFLSIAILSVYALFFLDLAIFSGIVKATIVVFSCIGLLLTGLGSFVIFVMIIKY